MFARGFTRSAVVLSRSTRVVNPVFRAAPVLCNAMRNNSNMVTSDKELFELRQRTCIQSEFEMHPDLAKLDMPPEIDSKVTTILAPLLHYSYVDGNMAEVREQLKELVDIVNDSTLYQVFARRLQTDPQDIEESFSTAVAATIFKLADLKQLKKIAQIEAAFGYVYRQISAERFVRVILPAQPSNEEVELLENELKAFYFKDINIDLKLEVFVNKDIGSGRIYCFQNYMLDLTTQAVEEQLLKSVKEKETEYSSAISSFEGLMRKPLNADLPKKNSVYQNQLKRFLHRFDVACGMVAS